MRQPDMPPARIVLDTNICLDLFVFQDARSHELMRFMKSRDVETVTRKDCRDEWLRVIEYPVLSLDHALRLKCAVDYDRFIACADFEQKDYSFLPKCNDPDDHKFLELAHDANARFLVTRDKALLKLSGKTKKHNMFRIIKPEQLTALMSR